MPKQSYVMLSTHNDMSGKTKQYHV